MEEKDLLKIKQIFKKYIKENNTSLFNLSILLNVSEGTVKTYLSGKKEISLSFISKFCNLRKLDKNDGAFLKEIIKKNKKISMKNNKKYSQEKNANKKNLENDFQAILKKIVIYEETIEKLTLENSLYKSILESKENTDYITKRKISSFSSDLENRTLIIAKIWNLNDQMFKLWGEIKLLLDINNPKSNIKMSKGLNTISDNLQKIANEIKIYSFNKEIDINKEDEIIEVED